VLPLVSYVEYALHALLRLEKTEGQTDGRTERRQSVTLRFPLNAASIISQAKFWLYIREVIFTERVAGL